jgi:hypothetical protein
MRAPRFATPQNQKLGKEGGGGGVELGGSVNNHNLKKMNQAYIQIK